jgi:molybdate transport system ATP-binding protein
MSLPIITADHISFSIDGEAVLHDITLSLNKGECLVLTGPSGSGKTILAKILAGHYPVSSGTITYSSNTLKKIFVHQQHDFRFAFQSRSYFGQRFDRNYGDQFPTVYKILSKDNNTEKELNEVIALLQLQEKIHQPIIELSNGEGKRVQLALALLSKPDILILDQPFIGLDIKTRLLLHDLLATLKEQGITIILISTEEEIPLVAERVVVLEQGSIQKVYEANEFSAQKKETQKHTPTFSDWRHIQEMTKAAEHTFDVAVKMDHVHVKFGEKSILDDLSWTIKRGEHWALVGHNGSGKSTLLSLITADNPQVYLNDVYLFDKKRGSGESIWEIKQKIGYVSPEMHNQFQRNSSYIESQAMSANDYSLGSFSQDKTTCYEVVCSGFKDQIGSSTRISDMQQKQVGYWMQALETEHLKQKAFHKASLGEQRLLLLARALVKNPPVLILDEPCQGLDKKQTHIFTSVLDNICAHIEKTLIYVSHYNTEMPACIDHTLILEKGKVIKSH